MASYVLMCVAKTGTTDDENDGNFDSVTWVSPGNNATMPNPALAALTGVTSADTVAFAVQVQDSTGAIQASQLDWVSVSVSAVTQPGNRTVRFADNESPFRIGSGNRPNTMLLASRVGNVAALQGYDANGNAVASGGVYLGTGPQAVFKDIPRGASAPNRTTPSQYEAVIGCSLTDASGQTWQFTFDPEFDVDNE